MLIKRIPVAFILLFIFGLSPAFAQRGADELSSIAVKAASDTAAITSLVNLSIDLKDSDPAKALGFLEKAYIFSEKLGHIDGMINSVNAIGDIQSMLGETKKGIAAIEAALAKHSKQFSADQIVNLNISLASLYNDASDAKRALEIFTGIKNDLRTPVLKARYYANRGNSYQTQGEYSASLSDYQKALEIYLELNMSKQAAISYSNLGLVCYTLEEWNKSLGYYIKAVDISEKTGDLDLLGQSYSNIGATYQKMDSVDQAINFYNKGLEVGTRQNNKLRVAQNLLNLGNLFTKQKKYEKALQNLNRSFQICKESGITYGLMMNYIGMGELYYDMENYPLSIDKYDSARVIAEEMNLPNEKISIWFGLAGANEKTGNFKNALEFHKKAVTLKDSLFALEKQKVILDLNSKYENEKKEKQIADQQFTLTYTIFAFIAAAITLVSLVGFLIYRNRSLKLLYLKNLRELNQTFTHIEPEAEVKNDITSKLHDPETSRLYNRIIDHLRDDKPWLDPDFNINDLAKSLMTNRTYLSSAITKGSGEHFSTLVNTYRINEAKRLIIESVGKPENIDDIMSKCGFRNRGTFNSSFNKLTGMTPGQFRKYSESVHPSENDQI